MASQIVLDGTLLTSLATNAFFIVRMVIDRRRMVIDRSESIAEAVKGEVAAAIVAATKSLPCSAHGERLSAVEQKCEGHAAALRDLLEENRAQHGRIFAILDDIRVRMIK